MEPTPAHAGAPAELIVQNGRQKGSRRPLRSPTMLIGRAAGCDLRLNVEGIAPLHCVLVQSAEGLFLRDLHGSGTVVNGLPTNSGLLSNGDLLAVGPFQFQVRVSPALSVSLAQSAAKVAQEKNALRVQAAAIAAQQAELIEEESKLQQRRTALDQQEEQLAAHLEEKRRKLIELRDQARAAHNELRGQRTVQAAQFGAERRELAALRRETEGDRQQAKAQRQRVSDLHKRLKRRFHRQWSAERVAMQKREEQVAQKQREFDRETERLRQEREALHQARLAWNGDVELGRRQLQVAWDALRQEQRAEEERYAQTHADAADQQAALDQREAALLEAEQALADEQQRWQEARLDLDKEVEGLENRVRNHRRKIFDQQEEAAKLDALLTGMRSKAAVADPEAAAEQALGDEPPPAAIPVAPLAIPVAHALPIAQLAAPEGPLSLAILERLAGELADQRLHLMEQCQRFIQAQQRWQHNRDAAAGELEMAGRRLHERACVLDSRAQALETAEEHVRHLQREAAHLQRYLEGWQSRMTARETAWEGDRDRLLADVNGREKLAEQRLEAVDRLHQRWSKRRRREIEWLRAERSACQKLRREWVQLRDEWLQRSVVLEKEQRSLAERALALEQFQQECLGQSANASAAARRMEKLRRRWAALTAATEKSVVAERQTLDAETARVEQLRDSMEKQAAKLAVREAEFAERLVEWERMHLHATNETNQLRKDAWSVTVQRDRFERQVGELRDEVERLARLLLDEAEPVRLATAQAA